MWISGYFQLFFDGMVSTDSDEMTFCYSMSQLGQRKSPEQPRSGQTSCFIQEGTGFRSRAFPRLASSRIFLSSFNGSSPLKRATCSETAHSPATASMLLHNISLKK